MRYSAPALILSAALLASCASSPPIRFSKIGGTHDAFVRDRYACIQEAQQERASARVIEGTGRSYKTVVTNGGVFVSCMAAKGYVADEKGEFAPPPGAEVALVD